MTPQQLRRKALAMGAELEIDGTVFNASREQIRAVPKVEAPVVAPAVVQPAPAAAPVDTITRAEVLALLEARDAAWQMLFAELGASVAALRARKAPEYSFDFAYDELGRVERGKATPKER